MTSPQVRMLVYLKSQVRSEAICRAGKVVPNYFTRCYRVESPTAISDVATVKDVKIIKADDATAAVKALEDIPGPDGKYAIPYLGSIFLFHPFTNYKPEQSNQMFAELHRKYGRIVKFRKGLKWSVLLFDPDLIEEAMNNEGRCPVRPSPPLSDVFSVRTGKVKGLSQVQGENWLNMRRPLQEYMLHPSNTNLYTPALNEIANELKQVIKLSRDNNGCLSVENITLRYAIESSALYCTNHRLGFLQSTNQPAAIAHSLKPNETNGRQDISSLMDALDIHHHCSALPGRQFVSTVSKSPTNDKAAPSYHHYDLATDSKGAWRLSEKCPISKSSNSDFILTPEERATMLQMVRTFMTAIGEGYYTFPWFRFFKTKLYRDFEMAAKYIYNVIQGRIIESAECVKRDNGTGERPNLLQVLLTDGRLDFPACVSMVTGFFSTATDNISNSLTLVLWHLAKNPQVQDKLREEIRSRIPSITTVTSDELSHIPYLKACLKESQRLAFPTPLGTIRAMPKDITLAGYHIPAGTWVNFGHNVLGHSREYFERPAAYMPERWLKQPITSVDKILKRRQAIITMPFGFGKRNCVGRRLAEQQINLALIKILQNYRLTLGNPDEELDIIYKIGAMPSKPLDIRFIPLNS